MTLMTQTLSVQPRTGDADLEATFGPGKSVLVTQGSNVLQPGGVGVACHLFFTSYEMWPRHQQEQFGGRASESC